MVKTVKVWKMNFFKNDDDNGGAQNECIKHTLPTEIVIKSETKTNGSMWGNIEPNEFLKMLPKNRGLYEVITKFPHKMYFDIDKDGVADYLLLDKIKPIILQYFPNADMAISGSVSEKKTSYHIVLQNYHIHTLEDRQKMKHVVKYLKENEDASFDDKVYTKNRNMKCINQSKEDGRIQTLIENTDYRAHCITCFIPEEYLIYSNTNAVLPEAYKFHVKLEKANKTFDLAMLPKMKLATPENFDSVNATAEDILSIAPCNKDLHHDYTHLVARFCFHNGISFEKFMSWIAHKHNPMTEAIRTKWENHFKVLDKFPTVTICKMLSVLNTFYPHIKKDLHFRQFSESFELPEDKICKIETISQAEFNMPEKYSIFNVGMGGGKTAQTISYLTGKPNYIWITPNVALSTNTKKRFEDEGLDLFHYKHDITLSDKQAGKLKLEQKLIICLNSLHYVEGITYDILVIDEIETLLNKFLGDFTDKYGFKHKIWTTFIALFKNAKKVVLLDAFITAKTINFIQMVESNMADYSIYERIHEPETRTVEYVSDFQLMKYDIIEKLKDNKKLFIFYPLKDGNNINLGMEEFSSMLSKASGKTNGRCYNASVESSIKKEIRDVNTCWKDFDYVITNNVITCGVNYEGKDFDYVYIFISSLNSPRDITQVSYRTRHLNSNIIKVNYMGRMQQPNTWLNDSYRMNCPIYTALTKDLLMENKSPLKNTFQLFCEKAHYKQTTSEMELTDAITEEMLALKYTHNLKYSYDILEDIDEIQVKNIEDKIFAQEETMLEKMMVQKYYFKKMFTKPTFYNGASLENSEFMHKMLKEIWEDGYIFVFQRLRNILWNEDHVFNKIARENDLKLLFPAEIVKMKLSKELRDDIFKQFSFKYISAASSPQKIIKEIFNTYFSKHIITIEYATPKNPIYIIDADLYRDYYVFAKEYLVLGCSTYNELRQEEHDIEFGNMDKFAFAM